MVSRNRLTERVCSLERKQELIPLPAMSALYLILLLFSARVVSLTPERTQRSRRGLLELAGAIKCSTGRSALSYMMYGCYCGLGGRGWPRDRADWCCHRHDCCYGKAEFAGCRTMTDRYNWTCEDHVPDCDSLKDRCERILCHCDREAAKCLRKAPFIRKYAVWPDFLCGCEYPTCSLY